MLCWTPEPAVIFPPAAMNTGGHASAHVLMHVTLASLSGTNMYSVMPLDVTRMLPSLGTCLASIVTLDGAADADAPAAGGVPPELPEPLLEDGEVTAST